MGISKLLGKTSAEATAISWGVACELRRWLPTLYSYRWPAESLTPAELRSIRRANEYMRQAENEIRKVQSSISKRSKANGHAHPDWRSARRINPSPVSGD